MISIRMYDGKWRILINEEFEFECLNTLKDELNDLLRLKDIYGRIR
jgi:hypothetical protein